MTIEEILEAYSGIEREDVLACIAYGAEMRRGYYVEIPFGEKSTKPPCEAKT
jgi:uncharacterized protein (DUF433 family)